MKIITHKDTEETPGGSRERVFEYMEWEKYPAIEFRSERGKKGKDDYDLLDRHGIVIKDDGRHFLRVECYEVKTTISSGRTRKTSHSFQIRKGDIKYLKSFIDKITQP